MSVTAVLGAQWGDEGKGKIVDNLSESADVVARFQGGANAGHTILVKNRETILHQLPSGILREKSICILGNGMVIDPIDLRAEIDSLRREGINVENRIFISLQAHIVTPLHKILDSKTETALGKRAIGTTKRGIGPCYTDKISRCGIQVRDLKYPRKIQEILQQKIEAYSRKGDLNQEDLDTLRPLLGRFYDCLPDVSARAADTSLLMDNYIRENRTILIEGAQGTLLDPDFGSYPFVTSSNTTAGYIATGLGISPGCIDRIIGIYKSYITRVGAGPFPTELFDKTGDYLQQTGSEFGATTRRRRRCGWFDAALGRYAARINGFSSIAITKLDVLDQLDTIRICTNYRNGDFPAVELADAEPQYIDLKGWRSSTALSNSFSDLPLAAQRYVKKIEELLDTPVEFISVGKERHQLIRL